MVLLSGNLFALLPVWIPNLILELDHALEIINNNATNLFTFVFFPSSDAERHCCTPDRGHLLSSKERFFTAPEEHSFEDDKPAMECKSYKRRFYILFLFSLISFCQYCAWNTYGPIATTAKSVFGWSNTQIAVLASMDPITYLCTMHFFSWMMDEKGN